MELMFTPENNTFMTLNFCLFKSRLHMTLHAYLKTGRLIPENWEMMTKKLFHTVLLMVLTTPLIAQNLPYELDAKLGLNIDSIASLCVEQANNSNQKDSINSYYFTAAKGMLFSGRLDSAEYFTQLMDTANSSYESKWKFSSLSAGLLFYMNREEESVEAWKRLLPLALAAGDQVGQSKCLGNISASYLQNGSVDSALKYLPLAIEVDEKLGDASANAYDYNLLGVAYYQSGLYSESIEALEKGVAKSGYDLNLGDLHLNLSNAHGKLDQMSEAEFHAQESLKIFSEFNNDRGKGKILKQLALIEETKNNIRQAIAFEQESLELSKKTGNVIGVVGSQGNVANRYMLLGLYDKALVEIDSAQAIASTLNKPEVDKSLAMTKIMCLSAKGEMDQAQNALGEFEQGLNNLYNDEYREELSSMEAKLNKAEDARTIAENQLEIESLNNRKIISTAIIVVLLITGFLMVLWLRSKQKSAIQQVKIEEREASIANEISAAEQERATISRELHDGIGQQLSAIKMQMDAVTNNKDL
ncbi:MAG: hypothetical protein HRT74_11705, partial [Flavobacteriales bacterium]|nr:hypothetical protein [Flavobacteriales bacterium]